MSPGRLFLLNEDAISEYLSKLANETKGKFEYTETAGMKQVIINSSERFSLDTWAVPIKIISLFCDVTRIVLLFIQRFPKLRLSTNHSIKRHSGIPTTFISCTCRKYLLAREVFPLMS